MTAMQVVASAIGVPARAAMLAALMDGRALTATELALEAEVTPSTASSHLATLERAGLLDQARQGRHRYFRIASPEVAALLERMETLLPAASPLRVGPRDPELRRARVCYDHLAGALATTFFSGLLARGLLVNDGALRLSANGERWFQALGVDLRALSASRRPAVGTCLDWSERRDHLSAGLGAAVLSRLFDLRLARRAMTGRAVAVTPRGQALLERFELGAGRY